MSGQTGTTSWCGGAGAEGAEGAACSNAARLHALRLSLSVSRLADAPMLCTCSHPTHPAAAAHPGRHGRATGVEDPAAGAVHQAAPGTLAGRGCWVARMGRWELGRELSQHLAAPAAADVLPPPCSCRPCLPACPPHRRTPTSWSARAMRASTTTLRWALAGRPMQCASRARSLSPPARRVRSRGWSGWGGWWLLHRCACVQGLLPSCPARRSHPPVPLPRLTPVLAEAVLAERDAAEIVGGAKPSYLTLAAGPQGAHFMLIEMKKA